jgi:peptide/nickel transport system substrate-binding protein
MKKNFQRIFIYLVMMLVLAFGIFNADSGAAPAEKVQYGGTLTYLDRTPTLNPMTWDIDDWNWKHGYDTGFYMEHLLMGDLQKGPRGTKKFAFNSNAWIPPDVVRGELLEKWETKKNPMQLILHLRKGIMWQEKPGVMKARELVADDVVYALTRLKNAKKAIPLYMDFMGKMETPDKYTVVINMTEWCADWWYRIGWGYYDGIQAPEQEKAPGGPKKWENACGTGPYMLAEYKEGHSQIYTKNPNYWDSESIGGKKYKLPFTDKVVMQIIKDEATQIASLRTGKIDLMLAMNWKHVDGLKKSNPQLQWARYLYTDNFTVALRMDQKPFNDIRVRRAMNLAINKKEIVDSFFGGNAELHTYPFPPSFADVYTPLDKLPPSVKELYTYNPEKAKKLLAEAGYPNGFTFKANISNAGQTGMDLGAMVVAYLAKIGVNMVLEPLDYPSHLSRMTKKNHSEGYFFSNDQGTPFAGLRKNFLTGQTWNPHMMSDPYVDKTWQDTVENPKLTDKQALAAMKKLSIYIMEQVPCIILPTSYVYAAWWPWVKNYYGEQRVGAHRAAPIIARIWIDQELKKKMGY